jgi:hypothetical protein
MTAAFGAGCAIQMYGRLRGEDFADQLFDPEMANYKIRAVVKPEFPNEQVRKHAMASQVRNLLSESTIMEEYLDIDQPDDERARRIQEMVDVHPAVIQYNLMIELTKRAKKGDVAALMALNALASQQATAQAGAGQKSPRPSQPEGVMSSTGQPTPQEQGGVPNGQSPESQLNGMINATPSSMTGELE